MQTTQQHLRGQTFNSDYTQHTNESTSESSDRNERKNAKTSSEAVAQRNPS